MSYKITESSIMECFENHKATLKILNEDTQTLEWKEPGTIIFQIDYVFHKNMLFVSGDLGGASFCCTWCPKWDTNNGWLISIDYLFEKLSSIKGNKYDWDSEIAINDLKDTYKDYFRELKDEEFEEMSTYIIAKAENEWYSDYHFDEDDYSNIPYGESVDIELLLQYCIAIKRAIHSGNESEFVYSLQNDEQFRDTNDFWEHGYTCGRRINSCIKYYLAGLQMAYEQLSEMENKDTEGMVSKSHLADWYINSVLKKDNPIWTIEHINELLNDFDVYFKDDKTAEEIKK